MQPVPQQKPQERRRHSRVKLALLGRYMLADQREYPCQSCDISPGGLCLIGPVIGRPGERVVAYFDHIGRLEGAIVRTIPDGFAMSIAATPRKREKLADQLTWLANRQALGMPEDRRHERSTPRNVRSLMVLPDGREFQCRVLDISLSGAAVQVETQPPLNAIVTMGRTSARIVRHFEGGVGIEFVRPGDGEALRVQLG
ncbi:PilZ domain-containing protein [Terrihabitans sp. B22-R8]|uniref:PilZ domain-containing protein n=1 Tax=Terrihabitans sp. B22-R8 TaxID=3425128 RepID=UPI00403CFE79